MTHNTAPPSDLTFWSFVDYAVRKAERELPSVDAEAMRMVLTLNRATSMVVYDLESSVHRPRGLTWPGFRVIFALWLAGPMEAKTTAEISGMSRAALSALLNTLERDGLIVRERAEHDRRALQLSLTEAGYGAILGGFRAHNRRESAWAEALEPDERRELVRLLNKLMAGSTTARAKFRS
ncbi:MarR family transcriptional regulator [Nocardiopsis sp. CNR-923]|uniref:MarR family winged helix-turn-helix transcriptional regulator n=1 Tax=Nocardiopsis sp. CNR-923 TaxID=1904965 RepID=UPI00095C1C56|nr:MarR family winged helix-turn-helix transcriptional regulator [Nocardiopsis sp. CNR-923]OLT29655.1 MarR family transcriptional regulator [Nocardiopsis sp. CNR-923]